MKGAKVRRSMGRQPLGVENQLSEGPAMTPTDAELNEKVATLSAIEAANLEAYE